jgi:Protein of unknown function (DUF3108)
MVTLWPSISFSYAAIALDDNCMLLRTRIYARFKYLVIATLFALMSSPTSAQTNAAERLMSATYTGKVSGWHVELERTLTLQPNGRYQLRSHAKKVFAAIEEISTFTLVKGQIQPQEYVYQRNIFGKKSVERIVFDWKKGRAIYTRSDRKQNYTEHPLTAGLLDPALYQLAIQADLAKGHSHLSYALIKRKRIEHFHLKAMKSEKMTLADKEYEASVVFREDADGEKSTKVWVLPALDFMIANIRHIEKNNDQFEIKLTKYSVDNLALNNFYRAFSNNGTYK